MLLYLAYILFKHKIMYINVDMLTMNMSIITDRVHGSYQNNAE